MTKWKVAFFLLAASVLAVLLVIAALLMLPSEGEKPEAAAAKGEPVFHVTASKAELNKLVTYYLEKEAGSASIDYDVYIGEQVELYGSFPVFGTSVDYYMSFDPEAMEDGSIVLEQKELRVGLLDIPASYVLKTADSAYAFPEWVHIVPDEERIYVSLAEMRLDNGMKVKAESFNLKENNIRFAVLLPEEAEQQEEE